MTDRLDTILKPYHSHSCHSTQGWVKGMTEPFPCDCDVQEAKAAITQLLQEERRQAYVAGINSGWGAATQQEVDDRIQALTKEDSKPESDKDAA